MIIKQDELYPNIKTIDLNLSPLDQLDLIGTFHELYFDTATEVEDFAVEFQRVVAHILSNEVPVELEHLVDFQETILDRLDLIKNYDAYKKVINKEDK